MQIRASINQESARTFRVSSALIFAFCFSFFAMAECFPRRLLSWVATEGCAKFSQALQSAFLEGFSVFSSRDLQMQTRNAVFIISILPRRKYKKRSCESRAANLESRILRTKTALLSLCQISIFSSCRNSRALTA